MTISAIALALARLPKSFGKRDGSGIFSSKYSMIGIDWTNVKSSIWSTGNSFLALCLENSSANLRIEL